MRRRIHVDKKSCCPCDGKEYVREKMKMIVFFCSSRRNVMKCSFRQTHFLPPQTILDKQTKMKIKGEESEK